MVFFVFEDIYIVSSFSDHAHYQQPQHFLVNNAVILVSIGSRVLLLGLFNIKRESLCLPGFCHAVSRVTEILETLVHAVHNRAHQQLCRVNVLVAFRMRWSMGSTAKNRNTKPISADWFHI